MKAAEQIKEALKDTDSKHPLTDTQLKEKTGLNQQVLEMWLAFLVEKRAIQEVRQEKGGEVNMLYWTSGNVQPGVWNSPVTQNAKELQAAKKLAEMEARSIKTADKPREIKPAEKPKAPAPLELKQPAAGDPTSKGFKILFALEQKPGLSLTELSNLLGFSCYQAHIKTFIRNGLVIEEPGAGRSHVFKLKEGYTARKVYQDSRAHVAIDKKAKTPTQPAASEAKSEAAVIEQPATEAEKAEPAIEEAQPEITEDQFLAEIIGQVREVATEAMDSISEEVPSFLKQALNAADDPHAQFAFTSDDTLVIKQGDLSIELNQADSMQLLNFIDNKARFAMRQQTIINQS